MGLAARLVRQDTTGTMVTTAGLVCLAGQGTTGTTVTTVTEEGGEGGEQSEIGHV